MRRPTYPSANKQLFGIIAFTVLVSGLDVAIGNGLAVRDPGGIYFILVLLVTYYSGLRAGLLCIVLLLSYLSAAPLIPGSAFRHVSWNQRHVQGLAIVLTFFSVLTGSIRNRIRKAEEKQYDAWEASETDRAERRQAEEALKSSEDLWRQAVDASTDAIVVADRSGRIALWSLHAEAVFGWSKEEIAGRHVVETLVAPALREKHAECFRSLMESDQSRPVDERTEMIGVRKDGSEFPMEFTAAAHGTGEKRIMIGFLRDITEYKKLQDRLRQAERMEAIGTLAGGIAHDFNNILTALGGNVALAKVDAGDNPAVQESLSEIEKSVLRATNIVGQILTFSRSRESNLLPVKITACLADAIKMLRATVPSNIEVVTRLEADLPTVMAEPADFHQIVLNLGANAAHAMRANGGSFEVSATLVELDEASAESIVGVRAGPHVRISFADTGTGMEAQTLEHIFDPFFTTKEVGEGTGLGLSVVYGIVERLEGAITAYSEPGRGTLFNIYLPATANVAPVAEGDLPMPIQGRAERILYVDDDDSLVFMMDRMLRRLNYQVTAITDSIAALEAFCASPESFDVIVTDVSMPRLDGPEFVRRVREIRPEVPVVMVTGYIRPDDAERARRLGVEHLVLKPNSVREMSDILNTILNRGASIP